MSTTQPAHSDEALLVAALKRGDERAFVELIDRYGSVMLRVAQSYVRSRAVAEEVVQETWIAVLSGVDRFEGRSSVKTWIFRILTNRAKTRAEREGRCVPFSSLTSEDEDWDGAVDAEPSSTPSTRAAGRPRRRIGARSPTSACSAARRSSTSGRRWPIFRHASSR